MSRSYPCVFVGYLYARKGYKVLNMQTKHIFISRDVKFFEPRFPLLPLDHKHSNANDSSYFPKSVSNDAHSFHPTNNLDPTEPISTFIPPLRRSTRIVQPLSRFKDYICRDTITNHFSCSHTITNFVYKYFWNMTSFNSFLVCFSSFYS